MTTVYEDITAELVQFYDESMLPFVHQVWRILVLMYFCTFIAMAWHIVNAKDAKRDSTSWMEDLVRYLCTAVGACTKYQQREIERRAAERAESVRKDLKMEAESWQRAYQRMLSKFNEASASRNNDFDLVKRKADRAVDDVRVITARYKDEAKRSTTLEHWVADLKNQSDTKTNVIRVLRRQLQEQAATATQTTSGHDIESLSARSNELEKLTKAFESLTTENVSLKARIDTAQPSDHLSAMVSELQATNRSLVQRGDAMMTEGRALLGQCTFLSNQVETITTERDNIRQALDTMRDDSQRATTANNSTDATLQSLRDELLSSETEVRKLRAVRTANESDLAALKSSDQSETIQRLEASSRAYQQENETMAANFQAAVAEVGTLRQENSQLREGRQGEFERLRIELDGLQSQRAQFEGQLQSERAQFQGQQHAMQAHGRVLEDKVSGLQAQLKRRDEDYRLASEQSNKLWNQMKPLNLVHEENQRLKAELERTKSLTPTRRQLVPTQNLISATAEVSRLRAEIEQLRNADKGFQETIRVLSTDLERLRGQHGPVHGHPEEEEKKEVEEMGEPASAVRPSTLGARVIAKGGRRLKARLEKSAAEPAAQWSAPESTQPVVGIELRRAIPEVKEEGNWHWKNSEDWVEQDRSDFKKSCQDHQTHLASLDEDDATAEVKKMFDPSPCRLVRDLLMGWVATRQLNAVEFAQVLIKTTATTQWLQDRWDRSDNNGQTFKSDITVDEVLRNTSILPAVRRFVAIREAGVPSGLSRGSLQMFVDQGRQLEALAKLTYCGGFSNDPKQFAFWEYGIPDSMLQS